jgi:hypothetical protein
MVGRKAYSQQVGTKPWRRKKRKTSMQFHQTHCNKNCCEYEKVELVFLLNGVETACDA